MANTVKFDRDEVLEHALQTFWQKGFLGSSTRDLQKATNLKPGSLYSSFGNKSELYKAVLQRYIDNLSANLTYCIDSESTVLNGITAFFNQALSPENIENNVEQCLLVKTISELQYQIDEQGNNQYQDLISFANLQIEHIETRLASHLQTAMDTGELSKTISPSVLAKKLQIQFIGLRQYACISKDAAFVEQQIKEMTASTLKN